MTDIRSILQSTSATRHMPAHMQPGDEDASWWASFFLQLGEKGDYDQLIHYLTLAQKIGCLSVIRATADRIIAARKKTHNRPSVTKVIRRKSTSFKAVA